MFEIEIFGPFLEIEVGGGHGPADPPPHVATPLICQCFKCRVQGGLEAMFFIFLTNFRVKCLKKWFPNFFFFNICGFYRTDLTTCPNSQFTIKNNPSRS